MPGLNFGNVSRLLPRATDGGRISPELKFNESGKHWLPYLLSLSGPILFSALIAVCVAATVAAAAQAAADQQILPA